MRADQNRFAGIFFHDVVECRPITLLNTFQTLTVRRSIFPTRVVLKFVLARKFFLDVGAKLSRPIAVARLAKSFVGVSNFHVVQGGAFFRRHVSALHRAGHEHVNRDVLQTFRQHVRLLQALFVERNVYRALETSFRVVSCLAVPNQNYYRPLGSLNRHRQQEARQQKENRAENFYSQVNRPPFRKFFRRGKKFSLQKYLTKIFPRANLYQL